MLNRASLRPAMLAIFVIAAFCAGCSSGSEDADAGSAADVPATGNDTGVTPDAGGETDAGADAGEPADAGQYPDPKFVNEVRTQPVAAADDLYKQEFTEYFRTTTELPDLDVRALQVIDGTVYAGTATGVYAKASGEAAFSAYLLPRPTPTAVVDIASATLGGDLVVAFSDRVVLVSAANHEDAVRPLQGPAITSVATDGTRLVAGTEDGVYEWKNDQWEAIVAMGTVVKVTDVALGADGKVYAATQSPGGVMVVGAGGLEETLTLASGDLADDDARAVRSCGTKVVFATKTGVTVREAGVSTIRRAGIGSFPTDDNLSVSCNATHLLVGHAIGATLVPYDLSKIDHYSSGRWLMDNRVPALALADGPVVWTGGAKGATRIYLTERRLADKEKAFDALVPSFWRMDGFVAAEGYTPTAWDDPATMFKDDKDNDGLWTQMMIGGWCFAYAATGEQKYHDYAWKALQTMFLQIDIPAVTFAEKGMKRGFIARSLVREDETTIWERKKTEAEMIDKSGGSGPFLHWQEVTYEGRKYLWKSDTSSDEYAGHFFGYPVYFDLCATAEEKELIKEHVHAAASYIVDGGYKLIDLDGTHTTWGRWEPEFIPIGVDGPDKCNFTPDCLMSWGGGGWLNANEALGMMLAAWHITEDPKFYDSYKYLIKMRYGDMAMPNQDTATITQPAIANHSDHELAMLAYTTLLRYEPDDAQRARWIESLMFLYDHERIERNPWWTAVAALSGAPLTQADIDNSRRTLRELPDDVREWRFDNAYRKDIGKIIGARNNSKQCEVVVPYDEFPTMWWNGNPRDIDGGGAGNSFKAVTFWLLPYYMNLYAGAVTPVK